MYYLGVDLGGTNIAVGLVTEDGKIIASDSIPTLAEREYPEIVADMAKVCKKVVADAGVDMSEVASIGIGSPGSIDSENGVVLYANNLKFNQAPIAAELKKHIDLPVNIENDANAAAYGEYIANGNGADDFVFITLGTGVGGGIIIDKKLYKGFNGIGGELGHITLVHNGKMCSCGNPGCWEAYASVTALISQTKEAIEKNPDSLMAKIAEENGEVSGRTAFNAAKAGDAAGQAVVDQYRDYVASGLVSIINIFQPERIVIGGGISREGEYLLAPIREYCDKYGYNKILKKADIQVATLYNDAGIIGAALAARKE